MDLMVPRSKASNVLEKSNGFDGAGRKRRMYWKIPMDLLVWRSEASNVLENSNGFGGMAVGSVGASQPISSSVQHMNGGHPSG